jgi:hypothetical protein
MAFAVPTHALPEAVLSAPPPLPSQGETVLKAAIFPAWAAYDLGHPQVAAGSAAVDFILVVGILDMSRHREPFAQGLRGLLLFALAGHHAGGALVGSLLQTRYAERGGPDQMRTGEGRGFEAFLGMGQYQNTMGLGVGYSFEDFRITVSTGSGVEQAEWGLPDTGTWMQGEALDLAPVLTLGLEGRWRLNSLVRLHPGVQIQGGALIRSAWADSGGTRKQVSSRDSYAMWIIPSLAAGFDPFRIGSVTLGAGWEVLRPGMARSFERQVEAHGKVDPILPRLRLNAQAEVYF